MEEIDDLLINPGRIIIKETVGNGVAIYRRAQKCFIAHDSRFLLLGKFGEVFKGLLNFRRQQSKEDKSSDPGVSADEDFSSC